VDLDRFKVVNDSLGHRAGDDVLCTVASRLVTVVREGDTVARFGGDEFTILLEEMGTAADATATAERIVQVLRRPLHVGDREVVLSASIGIAVAEPGSEPGDLLAAADIAMYEAKAAGKDRWSVAAAGADDRALARLDLEMELRRALQDDELELHYQPVVHTDGGDLHGLEALVRWRHPTFGLLAPTAFMELAEDTGLVLPLGEWVLERACRDGRAWNDRHPEQPTTIAVNLSGRRTCASASRTCWRARDSTRPCSSSRSPRRSSCRTARRSCRRSTSCAACASSSRSTTSAPASRRCRT
jgi:diguanylate cyclase (GGDEF)-like protein